MSLLRVLRDRGYQFRQHLEEESWTARKLTVVDLDESQSRALELGGVTGLERKLRGDGLWSFPAMDIAAPLKPEADLVLAEGTEPASVMVAPGDGRLRDLARAIAEEVHRRSGAQLQVVDDREADLGLLASQHVIVVGGSHESRWSMDLALRHQTGFVDATVPGDDGWVVTTHVGLDGSGHNVAQIAAGPSHQDEVLAYLLDAIDRENGRTILSCTHRVAPGSEMRDHFPSWEEFVTSLPKGMVQLEGQCGDVPEDPVALADLLGRGLHSGGYDANLVNNRPIDLAVTAAQYYQRSADSRALRLFRELLFRLADYYLKTPEGASIPSDLDFRLGHLILYYARLEHEPVFSNEDRLILTNLLLACTRSIYEYTLKCWPLKADEPTRHNHETFAARSLLFAADYFARYGVEDVEAWRERVEAVFSGGLWHRFKQKENANFYEQFAFEHGAVYSAVTGHRLDLFDGDCLRMAAMRQVATTDNFLRGVDYGDAGIHLRNQITDVLPMIVSSVEADPTLQWYSHEVFRRAHHYLPSPIFGIPGLRRGAPGREPSAGAWELVPLDPTFLELFGEAYPHAHSFDKLAFRTGWGDDDQYLLLEGIGNEDVSHAHNEVNGIVRLNHLGRHWVVSNGYGRLAGLTNVSKSFSTRVRGPEDHNMLVLQREGLTVRALPICSALLQRGQRGNLAYATGALLGYGGTNWFRTIVILADQFVLVIDRVQVAEPGLEAAHVEWNCLGEATEREGGWRLDQQGACMDVTSDSEWAAELGVADRSADWQRVLGSGEYPYAEFPLAKLVFRMPEVEAGHTCCLATLLAATHSPDPACRVQQPEPGLVCVTSLRGLSSMDGPLDPVRDLDLSIRSVSASVEVRFAETPPLPGELGSHHRLAP